MILMIIVIAIIFVLYKYVKNDIVNKLAIFLCALILTIQGIATYRYYKEPIIYYNMEVGSLEEYTINQEDVKMDNKGRIEELNINGEKILISKDDMTSTGVQYSSDKAQVYKLNVKLKLKDKLYKYVLLNNPPITKDSAIIEAKIPSKE